MQAPNNKAAPFSFHRCVFYSSSVSLISQWILRIRTFISSHIIMVVIVLGVIVLGVLAENVETGDEIKLCSRSSPRTMDEQQLQNAAFWKLCFHLSDIEPASVQRFQNRPVHEFYGLKASQISKVCASSHEYPHAEKKSRNFVNRISKVRWPGPADCHGKRIYPQGKKKNLRAKRKTLRQKEKPHGQNKNLTAKRKTSRQKEKDSRQKELPHGKRNKNKKCPLGIKEILPWVFFVLPWGFSFCCEVNSFAVTVEGHRTKVRKTTSNWIVRILNKVGLQ